MSSVKQFAAINTKVMAMEGKLLKKKDYQNLLEKKHVGDIITYLKENTAYKEVLENIDTNNVNIQQLEVLLKRYMVKQYKKMLHYFTGDYKKLFKIWLKRYEIEDIKIYLRFIMRKEDISTIRDLIIYPEGLDHNKLSTSKDLDEFIENLKGKHYYRLLKPYLQEEPEKRLFYMEMVLDRLYFKEFTEQAEKLDREGRDKLMELQGKNIDLLNIQWIYRGLKFYKISPEELINYVLPGGFYLGYEKLKALTYAKTQEELINKIIDSKYGFLFDNKDTVEIFMERRIERYVYFQLLDFKSREKMNIIESFVYVHLLEYEMRDVISIVEAVRYNLNSDEYIKFLIRKI